MPRQTGDDNGFPQDDRPVTRVPPRDAASQATYPVRNASASSDDLVAEPPPEDGAGFHVFRLLDEQLIKGRIRGDVAQFGASDRNTTDLLARLARRMGTRVFNPALPKVGGGGNVGTDGASPALAAALLPKALFSLLHVQNDDPAAVRTVLETVFPRVLPGGLVVVRDYATARGEAVARAVDAFAAEQHLPVVPLGDESGSAIIRKPLSGPGSIVAGGIVIGLIEHLGDIVACEPVIRHLKEAAPGTTITWVVRPAFRELLDSNPHVDAVVVVDCLTEWMIIRKHGSYDKVVDLHVNYRTCQCCGIPLIKTKGNPFVDGARWLDHGNLLAAFSVGAGLPKLSGQPQVYIQDTHRAKVDTLGLPEQFCVVHRRSNDLEKDWPDGRWRELIQWMTRGLHLDVVEVGQRGNGENEVLPDEAFGPRYRDLRGVTGILETAEVIRRAALFVGIDSGPAHLANAVGTPGAVLLGRYKDFRSYNPFSGFYGSDAPEVRIIRNVTGPVQEIEVGVVQEAIAYILSFVAARDGLPRPRPPATVPPALPRPTPTALPLASAAPDVLPKLLAFYLPQFHPIAENDAAHGAGFTEWNNVIAGKPLFKGHYQPRQPGELGYYDLRSLDVMRTQSELARAHGITGFCFYYYYFQGKRLLYRPIENFINSDIDMPFCFLWANENWSKRWDGGDKEVIIAQQHSPEDDLIFLRGLYPIFDDPRYVRVDGRPVLLIYKPHLFPDIAETTERWRSEAVAAGYPDLYLVMVDDWFPRPANPRTLGFDAAYEIPSNVVPHTVEQADRSGFEFLSDFEGRIVDYHRFAEYHANRLFPEYKRLRTVMAPWDNTARYRSRAMVHVNTDNDAYQLWVTKAYLDTYRRYEGEERLLFLHSWNEWCEGTYVEPDGRYGRKYLEETRDGVADAIRVIREAQASGFDLDAASLLNRIGREREEAHRVTLNSMRTELDDAWGEAGHLNNQIQSLRSQLDALHSQLDALRSHSDAVHRSTSWRVTRPLRAAKQVLRTVRR